MKNILITGSVLGATEGNVAFYGDLVSKLSCDDFEISSPLDTMKFKGTNTERFERAKQSVENADLIIAEVSYASHGQGMELMYAKTLDKEVVFIFQKGAKISGLIKGGFPNSVFMEYDGSLINGQISDIKSLAKSGNENVKNKA